MKRSTTESGRRAARAQKALDELGSHRSDQQRVSLQCRHAHHVAFVYDTSAGLVYLTRTGPRSHGSKDFVDTGKSGARTGQEHVDLLVAETDAPLPGWCDCGPWEFPRAQVISYAESGSRTVYVD